MFAAERGLDDVSRLERMSISPMKTWLRPLPFALVLGLALAQASEPAARVLDAAPSRSAALCAGLLGEDVVAQPSDVVWLDAPRGALGSMFGTSRALVRGKGLDRGEPEGGVDAGPALSDTFDVFLVTARLSPEGRVLAMGDVKNLTHTMSADEGLPVVHGSKVAFVVSVDDRPEAVHVLDFAGHAPHAMDELSRLQRLQVSIADWQKTGQLRGIERTVFSLVPAPQHAEVAFTEAGRLVVETDARELVIDPDRTVVEEGAAFARTTPEEIAKPATLGPWMSDRLRAVSWFGDEKNQVLKAVLFTGIEFFKNLKSKTLGDSSATDVAEDLDALGGKPAAVSFTDPETGWPPKPLTPLVKPALAGEGQWIALENDPFITPIPGVASPFLTTFVRSDPSALHTRVYVTLWDPRLIALHMAAGTVEPVSATGEAGTGQIPRKQEIMEHVVAGFNGGFQATHGEFGMQADGVLYLPPKPYAATVMELRDGTTAFGAWSTESAGGKTPGYMTVPEDVFSFRQNMTALVQNDKYNPWGRHWWGGVPPGWHDAIHTTRSGLCLTKENFVAYFWGNDIGPEPLGRAMLAARCAFGMHLDMNPGLAGFEFYDVEPTATFKPLGRPLQTDWEYEGGLKDMSTVKFRARRMVKSMGHILFPRYIHRDARDFFYLTARNVLPGAPIADAGTEGGTFRVKGLPQHGYPYAMAVSSVRLASAPGSAVGDRRVRVLRVDPRTVRAEPGERVAAAPADAGSTGEATGAGSGSLVLAFGSPSLRKKDAGAPRGAPRSDAALTLRQHAFSVGATHASDAVVLADLAAEGGAGSERARAAVGISDADGMLQWLELLPEEPADAATSAAMLALLERLGCSARALVAGDTRAFPGGSLDIGGEPAEMSPAVTARLTRTESPGARMYFNPPIVPLSVWQPLQAQRVKWRPTLAPPEKPAASASAGGSASPPPAGSGGVRSK